MQQAERLRAELTLCRQASEELHQECHLGAAILDTISTLVAVFDLEGHIIRFNSAFEQLTGYCLDEVKNQPFWDLFLTPDDLEPVKAVFRQLQLDQLPISDENDWLTKDGSRRRIAWSHTPFLDTSGALKYVISTGSDVSERRRAEQELERCLQERIAELLQVEQLQTEIAQLRQENQRLRVASARYRECFENKVAQEQIAELAKANDALRQTLDLLATESDLNNFLGHVLKVIAKQLDAPLTEYWFHPEPGNIAYLGLSCLRGKILTPEEQPGHPGVVGFPVPPEMIHNETLHQRQRHFVIEDATTYAPIVETNAQIGVDTERWCAERGVRKQLNVPLRLGEKSVGGLITWIPSDRSFTNQQIELAYALAQLVTLAIQLTQLAEQAKLAAIAKEQEKAALERVAELAKANSALAGTCVRLANQPDLSAFLGYVVLEAVAQLKADAGALSILNEQRGILQSVALVQHGQLIPIETLAAEMTIDEAEFYRILLLTRKPRFFDLETEAHLFWPGAIKFHRQHNHRAVLAVPLFADGKFFGHLGLAFTQNKPISSQGMELVQALAHQATLAIQLMQLAESVKLAALAREQEQAALERAAELALANDALRRSVGHLTTADSLNSFLVAVLLEAIQASGAVSAAVFVYNPSENTLLNTTFVLHGEVIDIATDPRTEIWREPLPADLTNGWQMMSQERRIIWFDNDNPPPEQWSMSIAWHHQFGHKTIAAIPLFVGEQVLGFLGLCFATHQQPSESKLEQCRTLAQHAALALQMSQLAESAKLAAIAREQEKAATERAVQLAKANNALKRNLDSLATQPELEAFLQCVVNEVAAQTRAASAYIFLYYEHTDSLSLSVATDNGGDWRSVADMELWKRPFPANSTPAWETITSFRTPFVVELSQANPLFWDGTWAWHQQRGHTRIVAATLWLGEKPLGFLGLAFTAGETFTPEELELVQALAQQATLAIELTSLAQQSSQAAILEERNRMAREIHDTLAQAFTGLSIHLGITKRFVKSQPESAISLIEQAISLAHAGLAEARRSVWDLQPQADDYRDLVQSLGRSLDLMTASTSIQTQMLIQGTPSLLPSVVGLNLLRIGQEALTNALKYAQAQHIVIELEFTPESVSLCVQDDGRGFDPSHHTQSGGFGLLGMRQRCDRIGAQLTITSQPGQGTAIVAFVPLVQG